MSLTAIAWLGCYVLLTLLALRRSAWGIALYLLTFYLFPGAWWWGGPLLELGTRINLTTALIFSAVVLFHRSRSDSVQTASTLLRLLLLYAVNATVVHILFAANVERSSAGMWMIWKQVGLLLLLIVAVKDRDDFGIFVAAVLVGALYIGYEVVVNGRGRMVSGRLEGVGVPGAREANYLAGLLAFGIPLAGHWLLLGNKWHRALAFVTLVLVFEAILRCNSRGAFLALVVAGAWMLLSATGRVRRHALIGITLGILAAYFMIGNEKIMQRFVSTFSSSEERDASAQSRVELWKAATRMIADHPLGSGAEAAFKSSLGSRYIADLGHGELRAVHNGYLDIGAAWGVQGLAIYLMAIAVVWRRVRRVRQECVMREEDAGAFWGVCLETTLVTQLVSCLFISSLDGEWFFWWFALGVAYERLYHRAVAPATRDTVSARSADGSAADVAVRMPVTVVAAGSPG